MDVKITLGVKCSSLFPDRLLLIAPVTRYYGDGYYGDEIHNYNGLQYI